MLGINEEAYFSPSLSADGGEACLKHFGGEHGGEGNDVKTDVKSCNVEMRDWPGGVDNSFVHVAKQQEVTVLLRSYLRAFDSCTMLPN